VENGTITANVTHFSTYRIIGTYLALDLSNVKAYPSPFNPTTAFGGKLKVINLPKDAEMTVYNIAGEKVITIKETDMTFPNAGWVEWNGKNETGDAVAQGVYVLLIKAGGTNKVVKIGLIK